MEIDEWKVLEEYRKYCSRMRECIDRNELDQSDMMDFESYKEFKKQLVEVNN